VRIGREQVEVYPDALAPGTEVGRWHVVQRLGVGGFGGAYKVQESARPGDFYVIKVALREKDERAEREVRLLMDKAVHPNVVRIHGHMRWPHPRDGLLCILMDWVPGQPLHTWAEIVNPSFQQLAEVGVKVARALGELHVRGVYHRDLKPEHIIIRESDGEPMLLDFGAGWYEGAATITSGTLHPCSLLVRSPESLRFHLAHHADPQAAYSFAATDDLYALGVCLYRAATGYYPFPPRAFTDMLQLMIMGQQPHAPAAFNRRVPRALSQLILRLLSKKPEDRYQSGAEVAEALVEAVALGGRKAWEAPLFEWEEVPSEGEGGAPRRRIHRPEPPTDSLPPPRPELVIPEPLQPDRVPAREGAPRAREPVPEERPARGARGWGHWLAGMLVLGLAIAGATWRALEIRQEASEPLPVMSALPLPRQEAGFGLEVATRETPPDAGHVAAPPPVESTPTALAPREMPRKEDAPVKKQQKISSLSKDTQRKGLTSNVLRTCVGVTAAAQAACAGGAPATRPEPQSVVRKRPPPEDCPPHAIEAMRKLDLFGGVYAMTVFQGVDTRKLHIPISVREGSLTVILEGSWRKLKGDTLLRGRLYLGKDRVYGRFTEAEASDGQTYPVCYQYVVGGQLGMFMVKNEPDDVSILPAVHVEAVERFE